MAICWVLLHLGSVYISVHRIFFQFFNISKIFKIKNWGKEKPRTSPSPKKSVRISEGHKYTKVFSKIKPKSQWFRLFLHYFRLFSLATNFWFLSNKWLKVIPWECNVHANSPKGILCNTYKRHVAMHSQVPCDCVGWIGPNRAQAENNCILWLCSECTINPSPGWNFRQFLEPG